MTRAAERKAEVLRLADQGATPAEIVAAVNLGQTRVYGILAKHRPDRPRQRRARTSDIPDKVRSLHADGIPPKRVAFLLEITPAYVYQILKENG